jgi:hypothetical protein
MFEIRVARGSSPEPDGLLQGWRMIEDSLKLLSPFSTKIVCALTRYLGC